MNALYGNTVGTALGTAAVGTCTTFARSDHVHPVTGLATIDYDGNGFAGLGSAGDYYSWLRLPELGVLPRTSNANGNGCVGTSGWPFLEMHAKNFYGTLCGCSSTSLNVRRNPYDASGIFNVALFDGCDWSGDTPLYVSNNRLLTYNPNTGVLSASSFSGTVTGTIWATRRIFSCASEVEAQLLEVLSDNYGYVTRLRMGLTPNQPGFRNGYLAIGCNDQGTAFDRFYFVQGHGGNVITSTTIGSQSVACATAAGVTCTFGQAVGRRNETLRQWSVTWQGIEEPYTPALHCDIYKAICWATNNATCFGIMGIFGSTGCSHDENIAYVRALERTCDLTKYCIYHVSSSYPTVICCCCGVPAASSGCGRIGGVY